MTETSLVIPSDTRRNPCSDPHPLGIVYLPRLLTIPNVEKGFLTAELGVGLLSSSALPDRADTLPLGACRISFFRLRCRLPLMSHLLLPYLTFLSSGRVQRKESKPLLGVGLDSFFLPGVVVLVEGVST